MQNKKLTKHFLDQCDDHIIITENVKCHAVAYNPNAKASFMVSASFELK